MSEKFIIQYVSGEFFGHGCFTEFAAFAQQMSQEQADKIVKANGRTRRLRVDEYHGFSGGGYDGKPPANVMRLAEMAA
jgi:hypothetical protein